MYSNFTTTAFLLLLVLPAFLAEDQNRLHRRTARSVGGFFKRIFGRNKQGFQGTANVNTLYNAQPSQSSYFPNYASYLAQPSEQLNTAASFADYQNSPYVSNGGYAPSNLQSNYGQSLLSGANSNQESGLNSQATDLSSTYASNYGNLAGSSQYSNYAALPSNQMTSVASNAQNVDFHKVLDSFVRSAGLSPNGDHDTAASSNVEQKGDTPVFSFKKLYSFPFYLNAEPNSNEGTYFSIPYMRKHIKRVSSDSNNQQVQPQSSSAASALMNYFGGKKLSDITKLYNHNQKYLQNVPSLNASFYNPIQSNPIYGNQLKKLAYYQVQQQYAKQNAANQLPPEIHLINNVRLPNVNNQPHLQHNIPNVMNQATNAYPTFAQPLTTNNQPQQSSNKQVNAPSSAFLNQSQQFQPIKTNHPSVTSTAVNQNKQQQRPQTQSQAQQTQQQTSQQQTSQQQQQQALIQQAINNPNAFISQYITQQYSNNNLNNNSNKLNESNSEGSDLVDEYSGSSYYYGQPQVSVSSSTSTKVSSQKQPSVSNSQTAPVSSNQQTSSSSSSAVSNQSNSNA